MACELSGPAAEIQHPPTVYLGQERQQISMLHRPLPPGSEPLEGRIAGEETWVVIDVLRFPRGFGHRSPTSPRTWGHGSLFALDNHSIRGPTSDISRAQCSLSTWRSSIPSVQLVACSPSGTLLEAAPLFPTAQSVLPSSRGAPRAEPVNTSRPYVRERLPGRAGLGFQPRSTDSAPSSPPDSGQLRVMTGF